MRNVTQPAGRILSFLVLAGSLSVILFPLCAAAGNGVSLICNVYELSGDRYRMDLIVENLGPDRDAVFKWEVWGVSPQWSTVSSWPPEWDFDHPDGLIKFQTGNGSYPGDGFYRIFGEPGAPPPCYGWTGLVFQWTFTRNGGPDPMEFQIIDYRFHIQPIGEEWENDGPSYTYPGPIAVEPQTWGGVKSLYQ